MAVVVLHPLKLFPHKVTFLRQCPSPPNGYSTRTSATVQEEGLKRHHKGSKWFGGRFLYFFLFLCGVNSRALYALSFRDAGGGKGSALWLN